MHMNGNSLSLMGVSSLTVCIMALAIQPQSQKALRSPKHSYILNGPCTAGYVADGRKQDITWWGRKLGMVAVFTLCSSHRTSTPPNLTSGDR